MLLNSGLDDRLTVAGRLLAGLAENAEYVAADDAEWAAGVQTVRDTYTEVLRAAPELLEAAVGLTVLAAAELRCHMVNFVDDAWWEEGPPVVEIPADDHTGQALAATVVAAAQHTLSIDPANNLAAFLEGLGHECAGAAENALQAYRLALELDPWDHAALDRAQELDEDCEPPDTETEPNPHSRHFWMLRCTEQIGQAGDEETALLRLTTPADVRNAIEAVLSDLITRDPDLVSAHNTDEYRNHQPGDFELITYTPNQPPTWLDLYDSLRPTTSGTLEVDWATVPLTPPPPALQLPPGQPVRVGGKTYFLTC